MKKYLSLTYNSYISNYKGLSNYCWNKIINNFVNTMLIGVFYFFSVYFVNILGVKIEIATTIISFYGLGAVFGGLIGGKLSDRINPGVVSVFSIFMQAIAISIIANTKSITILSILLFTFGFSTYSFITSNYLSVLKQCENNETEKLKALNILAVISNLGLSLSAVIIGIFASFGFKNVLITVGFLFFILGIFTLLTENKSFYVASKKVDNEKLSKNFKSQNNTITNYILICVFFVGCIISQMSSTYPIFLHEIFPYMGVKSISMALMLNSLLVVTFQAPLSNYFAEYNKIMIVGAGAFLLGFGVMMLNFSSSFMFIMFACVVYTIGEILFFSTAQLVCYQGADERKKGASLGLYRMIYASSRIAGPLAGGFIFSQVGASALWYFCGLIGFLFFLGCVYLKINN